MYAQFSYGRSMGKSIGGARILNSYEGELGKIFPEDDIYCLLSSTVILVDF